MKNLAIIPARGGSKRIPRKNVKSFLGKPMLAYSIEAALATGLFDEVMVSTDDEEIAEVARMYGAKVPFMRSAETSNDNATMEDVIEEVILKYLKVGQAYDNFCCLLATAPFITSELLSESYHTYKESEGDSLVPCIRFSYPVQRCLRVKGSFLCMREPEYIHSRSQDLEPMYHDSGLFYWMKTDIFLEEKEIFCEKACLFEIEESKCQDIDTEEDWKIAEIKYKILNELI